MIAATHRNRKTGKLVIATFQPAFDRGYTRQLHDVYAYHSLRDGKRFGPVMVKLASRFLELYEEVTQ